MDITLSLSLFAVCLALFVLSSWRAGRPHDSLSPRLIPWRLVIVGSGALGLIDLALLFDSLKNGLH